LVVFLDCMPRVEASPQNSSKRRRGGRCTSCAPVPAQGTGAALRCLLKDSHRDRRRWRSVPKEPWQVQTHANKMFDGVDGPITRGRIVGLGAGKKFLAMISTPEGGSSSLAVSHGLVTVKENCS
jgi:hypothetical protein